MLRVIFWADAADELDSVPYEQQYEQNYQSG